jgi:hypothetical protein
MIDEILLVVIIYPRLKTRLREYPDLRSSYPNAVDYALKPESDMIQINSNVDAL